MPFDFNTFGSEQKTPVSTGGFDFHSFGEEVKSPQKNKQVFGQKVPKERVDATFNSLSNGPVGSVIKALANVPARLGVSAYNTIAGGKEGIATPRDVPVLGETRGFSPVTQSALSPEGKVQNPIKGRALLDATGAGIEAGTYLAGGPEAKAGVEALVEGGGKRLLQSTFPKVGSLLGGLGAFGSSVQDPNATVGGTALNTALGTGLGALLEAAAPQVARLFGKKAVQSGEQAFNEALDISRPKITSKLEQQAFNEGRVGEQGLFTGAKIKPSIQETKVAEAVQPLIETGELSSKMAPTEQQAVLSNRVKQINSGVKELLTSPQYNQPFNQKQLDTYLNATKDGTKLLFAGDNASEKAYDAVISEFKTYVKKKNISGLFDARQEFDKFVRNKFPDTFKKNAIGILNPGDNARKQALLDVRNAANEMISDLLPKNNPYRDALKQESYLIQAGDNLSTKVRGITQEGKVSQFLKTRSGKVTKTIFKTLGYGTAAAGGAEVLK